MGVQRFEDLIAWQKSRQLVSEIYGVTRLPAVAQDFGFSRQLQRAGVSVMSNIAEGFELRSRPQFRRQLSIAKGSCAEVRSLFYVAMDIGYLDPQTTERLLSLAGEIARIIAGLIASISRPPDRP